MGIEMAFYIEVRVVEKDQRIIELNSSNPYSVVQNGEKETVMVLDQKVKSVEFLPNSKKMFGLLQSYTEEWS
jgi:predicted methyltransferase